MTERKLTPTQLRAALQSVVVEAGFVLDSQESTDNFARAWLRPTKPRSRTPRSLANRLRRDLRKLGMSVRQPRIGRGGEFLVSGQCRERYFCITVNQDPQCTEYSGGVFVEAA